MENKYQIVPQAVSTRSRRTRKFLTQNFAKVQNIEM